MEHAIAASQQRQSQVSGAIDRLAKLGQSLGQTVDALENRLALIVKSGPSAPSERPGSRPENDALRSRDIEIVPLVCQLNTQIEHLEGVMVRLHSLTLRIEL